MANILNKNINNLILTLLIFLFFLSINQKAMASNGRNLTIFAEPTMSLPLTKIVRIFSQNNNAIVSINFKSVFDLVEEIDQGAPANVFITAHPQIVDNLRNKGLVDVYNIAYIGYDYLTLCASKNNKNFPLELLKKNIYFEDALKILNKNKLNLILDHEGIASGIISRKILHDLSLSDIKIFSKLPEDRSSLIKDIESNKDVYGVVFLSQLKNNNKIRTFATQRDENVYYKAYVVAGENMDIAREFLNFLKGPIAKKILKDSGLNVD